MIVSLLALCLGIASCYDDAALQERIEALETAKIATISQQIEAIKQSITDLETTDKELDAAIAGLINEDGSLDERVVALNDSIANLQEADAATKAEIDNISQTLTGLLNKDKELNEEIAALQESIAALMGNDAQEQIAALQQTLQELKAQDEAVKEQIAQMESSIAELRSVDAYLQNEIAEIKATLQTLTERGEQLLTDIESLKAKDEALTARIEELKAYIDAVAAESKDWASTTFSTLEQYQATCNEIAAIKVLLAEYEVIINQALTDAITASETSMKGWVNGQLTGYWTVAETQAKLDTIQANASNEIEAVKADLKAATEELTAAYKSEITKAIEDYNGNLSARIDEINSALDKRIVAIEARLDALEEKINNLTREFAITFDDADITLSAGEVATIGYTITGATEKTVVKALCQNGWRAKVMPEGNNKGTIKVMAPTPITNDEIVVIVYDGEYRTIMSTLDLVKGFATPSQTVVELGSSASTVSIEMTTNIDYKICIPAEAQSWLSVVEPTTRATRTETIDFACTAFDGEFRWTTVTFKLDDFDDPYASISFIQQGKSADRNWMSRLPDETFVSVVSIPGAHDAATGSGWASGSSSNSFAQTQELSLSKLWETGVRAYDLRPCVKNDYLNINHGIVATSVRFDQAMFLLRDSLIANPSEFAVIHLQHETDGDDGNSNYNSMLLEVLKRDDLKDFFVDFKSDLTVGEMRGKILILSRNEYASTPIGGFFKDWNFGTEWKVSKKIVGPKSKSGSYFQQDFYNTVDAIDTKVRVFTELLDYGAQRKTDKKADIRWIINFASGYSKTSFGFASSNGYRDNATYTHAALLDYLANNPAGPTGIIMMDYAGVDKSSSYNVKGLQAVQAIIDNNFKYLGKRYPQ